jgi:hypothetical protein
MHLLADASNSEEVESLSGGISLDQSHESLRLSLCLLKVSPSDDSKHTDVQILNSPTETTLPYLS